MTVKSMRHRLCNNAGGGGGGGGGGGALLWGGGGLFCTILEPFLLAGTNMYWIAALACLKTTNM